MLEGMPRQAWLESEEFDQLTKREALASYKRQTGQLMERKNPFGPHHRAHHMFFDVAVRLADQATGKREDRYSIYSRSYEPYIKARSELSSYLSFKKSRTKMLKKQS